MPKLINMPKLNDSMTEGLLAKWHIKEGDAVKIDQVVADVETDKATMEMSSFETGTVLKLVVPAGGKAPVGGALVVLLGQGETAPEDLDGWLASNAKVAAPAAKPAAASSGQSAAPAKQAKAAVAGLPVLPSGPTRRAAAGGSNGQRVKASPLARKIAEEKGVDLSRLTGTGPGGRIVRADVEAAPVGGAVAAGPARAVATTRPVPAGPEDQRVPLSNMRKIIAERLTESKSTIPHFYLQIEVDAAPLLEFRAHINDQSEKTTGNKFTINDFILKAVIRSAAAVPAVNAAFDGDAIIQYKDVNLSVAIAVPDGLVTPVIRGAQKKTLLEISGAVKDMAARAKNKKLNPDEFAGGTITVSSLGGFGIDQFSAIINPPQAAIISVGSIRKVPVVSDKGQIVPGQRMWIGLSCDHRVVDGAVGATYLAELRKLVENPALMLV